MHIKSNKLSDTQFSCRDIKIQAHILFMYKNVIVLVILTEVFHNSILQTFKFDRQPNGMHP